MASTRFHKAAQDGNLDLLREATRRDANAKDEDGMTPTLWAAHAGRLEALRLLVGRGGDVEKGNLHWGQTALHLAAARGHLPCVSFLVGFDANLWALDLDLHTPLQVATSKEVLDFLDKAAAKQELTNKKDVKAKKEKAMKDVERRRKKYEERLKKERDKEEKRSKRGKQHSNEVSTLGPVMAVEGGAPSFTQLVGAGGTGTYKKPPAASSVKRILSPLKDGDAKNSQKKDSQIIYVNSFDAQSSGKRGKLSQVFSGDTAPTQASIFERPGFGSVAFRHTRTAGTLSGLPEEGEESPSSIGSAGSLANRNSATLGDDITTSDEENVVSNGQGGGLERFLAAAGLEEFWPQLRQHRVDLEALLMLSDSDLVHIGMPLGPRRKLLHAVEQRKQAIRSPGLLTDSRL